VGRTIAVEEVTEWICRHCGYDMGHGFIECEDSDNYKRDKNSHPYITCPECDTTFDPAFQSSYFKTNIPPLQPSPLDQIIVEHRTGATCTTHIDLGNTYTVEDIDDIQITDYDIEVTFSDGETCSYDINYSSGDFEIDDDISSTIVYDADWNEVASR